MLFNKLVANTNGLWDDYINHQFAYELLQDKISKEKFKNYLEQDYIYLTGYNECFKVIEKECTDQFEQQYFAACVAIESEMTMYENYQIDVTKVRASNVTKQYLNYMYEIMTTGTHLEKIVVIFPCIVGYGYIGQKLASNVVKPTSYFKTWIDLYKSEDFSWPVADLIKILNRYQVTEDEAVKLQKIFNRVCQLEIEFFNQAFAPVKPQVLTIAGSDSSGGAGIQADIKTISANGGYAASVITAITAQNTQGVNSVEKVSKQMVIDQLSAIKSDLQLNAIKIGMLADSELITAVSSNLPKEVQVVLDPVMVAKDGTYLINESAITSLVTELFPKVNLITPNIVEASQLLGIKITTEDDMKKACKDMVKLGCSNILLKGGHLVGNQLVDVLYANNEFYTFKKERIITKNTHGTGCSLSSAIATNLAKGYPIEKAVETAIDYVYDGIVMNYEVGSGCSPINHFHQKLGWYHE